MEYSKVTRMPNMHKPSSDQNIHGLVKPEINTTYQKPLKKETFCGLVNNFIQRVTVHGVSYLGDSQTVIGNTFWLLVITTALGATGYLSVNVVQDFFKWPYTTKIDLITRFNLDFPAVTICNMNRLRRSKLPGTRFQGLIDIDGGLSGSNYDYSWFLSWDSQWTQWWNANYDNDLTAQQRQVQQGSQPGINEEDLEGNPGDAAEVIEGTSHQITNSDELLPTAEELDGSSEGPSRNKRETRRISNTSGNTTIGKRLKNDYMKIRQFKELRENHHIRKRQTQGRTFEDESEDFDFEQFEWWGTEMDELDRVRNFEFYDYNWGTVTGANDWRGFYMNSKAEDFSDIIDVANPTREELEELGHQAEDFILQCTFDKRKCNYTDFKVFQNKHYGNCFVFNHGTGSDNPRTTSKSGAQFGLHLTLFIEQPEYVGIFTPESGVRVSIHDRNQKPFPEDDGLTAPPGFATSLGMKQLSISRLPEPHGNCTSNKFPQADGQLSEYQYSSGECRKRCLQTELLVKCQCVTDILPNNTKCSAINETQQLCRQLVEALYEEDNLNCTCPTACNEVTYTTSASSSRWPSERYEEHFKNRLEKDNVKAARLLDNIEQTRKNFVRLRIYFEELNYQDISQTPVYTVESILGNVGGLMGLYIGASLFSVVEVVVFIVSVIKLALKNLFGLNKVHAAEIVA